MSIFKRFRERSNRRTNRWPQRRGRQTRSLHLESLEDRKMMTLMVDCGFDVEKVTGSVGQSIEVGDLAGSFAQSVRESGVVPTFANQCDPLYPPPVVADQLDDILADLRCNVTNDVRPKDAPGQAVEVAKQVRIRLAITDLEGHHVERVDVGRQFVLHVFVQDLRPDAEGVFATYLDVRFDEHLASFVGRTHADIAHSDTFPNGKSGDVSENGLLNDAGGFSHITPNGGEEYELLSVILRAEQGGLLRFAGDQADEFGNDVLIYGENEPVPWNAVEMLSTSIVIGTGPFPPATILDGSVHDMSSGNPEPIAGTSWGESGLRGTASYAGTSVVDPEAIATAAGREREFEDSVHPTRYEPIRIAFAPQVITLGDDDVGGIAAGNET